MISGKLLLSVEKALDKLDAEVVSYKSFNKEVENVFGMFKQEKITKFAVLFFTFFQLCSKHKTPSQCKRYTMLRTYVQEACLNSKLECVHVIKSSFQSGYSLHEAREEEALEVKRKLNQSVSKSKWRLNEGLIFKFITDILELNAAEQVIFLVALATTDNEEIRKIGFSGLEMFIYHIASYLMDEDYLNNCEEKDINGISLPGLEKKSIGSCFPPEILRNVISLNLNLTPRLLQYLTGANSVEDNSSSNSIDKSVMTLTLNTEMLDSSLSAERVIGLVNEHAPYVAMTVDDISQYFTNLGLDNVSEKEVTNIASGVLASVKSPSNKIDTDLESAFETSFALLSKTAPDYKKIDLDKVSTKEKVTKLENMWKPEFFVKSIMKLKRESGLLSFPKLLNALDNPFYFTVADESFFNWMFTVLSQLNVKDKKVNVTDVFLKRWKFPAVQLKLLEYVIQELSKTEPDVSFVVRNSKNLDILQQREFYSLVVSLSSWGNFKLARNLFVSMIEKKPELLDKLLVQMISNTDYIEPDDEEEYDVFNTRVGERFLPLMWDMLGYMISVSLKEKKFDLLRKCWSMNGKEFLIKFLFRKYCENRQILVVILTLLKSSNSALNYVSHLKFVTDNVGMFVIDFVSNALPLEGETNDEPSISNWLDFKLNLKRTKSSRHQFAKALTQFLMKAFAKGTPHNLALVTVYAHELLSALISWPKEEQAELKEISEVLTTCRARLGAIEATELKPPEPQAVSQTTIDELTITKVRDIINLIVSKKRSITDILHIINHYKEATTVGDRKVFELFLKRLSEFLSKSPDHVDDRFTVLGIVIGVMIRTDVLVGNSLESMLEALKKGIAAPTVSMSYKMALFAIEQFKVKLPHMAGFASYLTTNTKFQSERPEFVRELALAIGKTVDTNESMRSQSPRKNAALSGMIPKVSSDEIAFIVKTIKKEIALTFQLPLRGSEDPEEFLQLCEKVDVIIPVPSKSEDVEKDLPDIKSQDKMKFIFNNLSKNNLKDKSKLVKEAFNGDKTLVSWFAEYLVTNIVSRQPNFHEVYAEFIELVDEPTIMALIKRKTLQAVKERLKSQLLVGSSNERSILKNLGAWLGIITLRKSEPLLLNEINIKELLLDGYERGWLIAVLPFVVKILDTTSSLSNSDKQYNFNVFHNRNPWIISILKLFAEIYSLRDLKLTLTFETEVIFKTLDCKVKDIIPSELLIRRRKPKFDGNPDFNLKDASQVIMRQRAFDEELKQKRAFLKAQLTKLNVEKGTQEMPINMPVDSQKLNALSNYIKIGEDVFLLKKYPVLRKIVILAIEKTVRDILRLNGERSCAMACVTTRQMIRKDLCLEWDEEKIKSIAQRMAASLAISLIRTSCSQQLRETLEKTMKSYIQAACKKSEIATDRAEIVDASVKMTASNLDLTSKLIERAVVEKATRDVIAAIEPLITVRQTHRTQAGSKYFDAKNYQKQLQQLPSILRPSPNPAGIDFHFLQVYDSFKVTPTMSRSRMGKQGNMVTLPEVAEEWKRIIGRIDRLVQECINNNTVPKPVYQDVTALISKVSALGKALQASGVKNKSEAAAMFAQRMFKRVFVVGAQNSASQAEKFRAQVQIGLLQAFVSLCEDMNIRRKMSEWVFATGIENRLNRLVVAGLLKSKVIEYQDFDACLSKVLEKDPTPINVSFAQDMIKICILANKFMKVQDIMKSLEMLHKIDFSQRSSNRTIFPTLTSLLDEVRTIHRQGKLTATKFLSSEQDTLIITKRIKLAELKKDHAPGAFLRSPEPPILRKQVAKFLHAWMSIYIPSEEGEVENIFLPGPHQERYKAYLTSLQQHRALSGEEATERFFRLCTELVFESALTNTKLSLASEQPMVLSYAAIDAFGKLVLCLVKYAKAAAKGKLVGKVLKIIANIFKREVENRARKNIPETIDQRPYFRLYINLLSDIVELYDYEKENLGEQAKFDMLLHFANILRYELSLRNAPAFAFAWMRIFAHPNLLGYFLMNSVGANSQVSTTTVLDLFTDLFHFLKQFPTSKSQFTSMSVSVKQMFFGTLKMLVVILHDNPGFLSDNYLKFLELVPYNWSQIRNIILSASPKDKNLPSPRHSCLDTSDTFSFNSPTTHHIQALQDNPELLNILRNCFKDTSKTNANIDKILVLLRDQSARNIKTQAFDETLVGRVLYFCGINAIQIGNLSASVDIELYLRSSPSVEIITGLLRKMNHDGQQLLISSVVDHLRYPCLETSVFAAILSSLFSLKNPVEMQELVTKVLLERLIVHKPHPWGLLSFFIQLVRNPKYDFWNCSFVHSTPEVTALLKSISGSLLKSISQKRESVS